MIVTEENTEIKLTEASTKIYFSTNYGQFSWMKGNRDLNELKIKRIVAEISSGNNLLKYAPIIVDQEFNILDGQHRFMCAKQTGNPVFFVIKDKMSISEVARLNSNTSNWKNIDYLNSYVSTGNENYIKLEELLQQHKMNILLLATLLHSGTVTDRNVKHLFIDGLFKVQHLDETQNLLNLAKDFEGYVSNPFVSRFLLALEKLVAEELYDHNLMIDKLKMSGRKIERIQNPKSIIANMEEIINFKNSKTQIRLI